MTTRTYALVWITAALVAAVFFIFMRTSGEVAAPVKSVAEPNLFPFVKSLEGTRSDDAVTIAADQTLVVDSALRNFFEYYLTAVGEKSIEEIYAETARELDRKLKPAAAAEAKRLWGRYLDYKRALLEVEKNAQLAGNASGAVRARLEAMLQVRSQFFSAAENKGLFGFDDAYDLDAVARLEIDQDTNLSVEQKRTRMVALDAAMPVAVREAREAPMVVVRLEESVVKMRSEGASEDDIYRMRAAAISPEAAARLSEVDRDESAWKSRIDAYLAEQHRFIAANPALSESARQTALQQLRQSRFFGDEQKRLAAYE
ncbi:MAG: lipase chaperone [Glaciimonas sp.]|nr:lipase chaperone [Glaciimonas sp.]